MWGPTSERLVATAGERTLEIAGTSPTSAVVGAAMAYLGVKLLRRGRGETT